MNMGWIRCGSVLTRGYWFGLRSGQLCTVLTCTYQLEPKASINQVENLNLNP